MQKCVLKLAISLLAGLGVMAVLGCGDAPEQQDASEGRAALKAKVVYYAIPG